METQLSSLLDLPSDLLATATHTEFISDKPEMGKTIYRYGLPSPSGKHPHIAIDD